MTPQLPPYRQGIPNAPPISFQQGAALTEMNRQGAAKRQRKLLRLGTYPNQPLFVIKKSDLYKTARLILDLPDISVMPIMPRPWYF
jgi:hypothetical protein